MSTIALVGQFSTHNPHAVHSALSIRERLFSTLTAFTGATGHTLTHLRHPVQPTVQYLRVTPPLSFEWHATSILAEAGSTSMTFFGHAAMGMREHLAYLFHPGIGFYVIFSCGQCEAYAENKRHDTEKYKRGY
jgi:hypothetical protein